MLSTEPIATMRSSPRRLPPVSNTGPSKTRTASPKINVMFSEVRLPLLFIPLEKHLVPMAMLRLCVHSVHTQFGVVKLVFVPALLRFIQHLARNRRHQLARTESHRLRQQPISESGDHERFVCHQAAIAVTGDSLRVHGTKRLD